MEYTVKMKNKITQDLYRQEIFELDVSKSEMINFIGFNEINVICFVNSTEEIILI